MIPLFVDMSSGGTDTSSRETQKGFQLSSRDSELHQVQHPPFRTSHALAPSPRQDQAAPPTRNTEPSVATWFPKLSTGTFQLLCFSDSVAPCIAGDFFFHLGTFSSGVPRPTKLRVCSKFRVRHYGPLSTLRWSSQHSLDWLQPHSCLAAHLLP